MPLINGDGNRLLTTDKVAKDMLARWKNNLVLAKSVYRDLEGQFGEIGDTISVKLPNNVIVNNGNVATTTTPLNDKTVSLVIDTQLNVKFNWGMKDKRLSIQQFGDRYLEPASNRLANEVDIAIAKEMQLAYFQFGTVGQPLSFKDVTMGGAYARDVAIPTDSLCRLITNTIDNANISNNISGVYNDALVKDAIQKGYAGELAGFSNYFSQNILTHTNGTYTGSEQVAAELKGGSQLSVKGGTAGGFKKGDRFTIDGVKEINPITKAVTGRLQVFTVVSDTPLSGATGSVTISPAINDGTNSVVDGQGNAITTAMDQNVEGKAVVDAGINVIGESGATYRENYIMHKHAVALACVQMELPASGHGHRAVDRQTGLAINVAEYFNGDQYENSLRMDILFGVKMVRPDLIFRATNERIG